MPANSSLKNKKTLPRFFKPLFWYCDFLKLDLQENKEEIIIQTINYGDLPHWQWLFDYYGVEETKKAIKNIPFSTFRKRAIKLILLIFKINKLKYASRSDRIKAQKSISRA